jgi:hypothetical protein
MLRAEAKRLQKIRHEMLRVYEVETALGEILDDIVKSIEDSEVQRML